MAAAGGQPADGYPYQACLNYSLGMYSELAAKQAGMMRRLPDGAYARAPNIDRAASLWLEAVTRYRRAASADPHGLAPLRRLAEGWHAFRGYDEAEKAFQELLARSPNDLDALGRLVSLYIDHGQPRKAVEAARRVVTVARARRETATMLKFQLRLLTLLRLRERRAEAMDLAERFAEEFARWDGRGDEELARLKRDPAWLPKLLGAIALEAGRNDQAISILAEFARKRPELAAARNNLAAALAACGRKREALGILAKAIAEGVADEATHIAHAQLAMVLGRPADAVRTLEKARERFGPKELVLRALAVAYHEAAQTEAAEKLLLELLAQNPDDAVSQNALAYLWAEQGRKLDQAESLVRKALIAAPRSGAYWDTLGWIYYKRGRHKRAVELLEQALLYDDDPVILEHLGDAYAKLGGARKALEVYRRAIDSPELPARQAERLRGKIEALEKEPKQ